MFRKRILKMKKEYLPKGWKLIEEVEDTINVGEMKIYRSGLFAKNKEKVSLGAASGITSQRSRAYYELLERIYLQEKNRVDSTEVKEYTFSITNGAAIHTCPELAKTSSVNELIERDRILRSWYGFSDPKELVDDKFQISEISKIYDIKLFEFLDENDPRSDIKVMGIFLYPKNESDHFLFGFGASDSIEKAFFKTKDELITRLSFLWQEEIEENYEFSPTSGHHQEFYLDKNNQLWIDDWLTGKNPQKFLNYFKGSIPVLKDDIVADVKKIDHDGETLYLSQASSKTREKLYFGQKYSIEKKKGLVHPIM